MGIYLGNTKLNLGVPSNEQIKSALINEPIGSDRVLNIVSLTTAEYNAGILAGTISNTTKYIITDAKTNNNEILVSTGNGDDVQTALNNAGKIPVRITADIIDLDRPILMDSNQTLIFEGYTIFIANDVSTGGVDPFVYWNGHAVIKNRNGAGIGSTPAGDWSGTGLGGEDNITVIGGTIEGTNEDPLYVYNGVQLHDVTNCKVIDVKCVNVLTRTSAPTGNFDTRNSTNIKFIDVQSINTDKTGLWASDTTDLLVQGGYFTLSGDSGIGGETNLRPVIDGVFVDNAGRLPAPNGASNITMDMRDGKFINSTSINASGSTNGYGLTLGHPDPDFALNTLVSNNYFEGNAVNGIRIQGNSTRGLTITGNTFINNGNGSTDSGAGGININAGKSNIVSNNFFNNNRHGVITSNGATDNIIDNNIIENSNQHGINLASNENFVRNNKLEGNLVVQILDGGTDNLMVGNIHTDGAAYVNDIQKTFTVRKTLPSDANLMTGSLLKLQPTSPSPSSAVLGASSGIAMQIDGRSGLYGMTAATRVNLSRSSFDYVIKAHKGTEAGTELFKIDDVGVVTLIQLIMPSLPTYADEAAAVTGGLATNRVYKTATGELRIKL